MKKYTVELTKEQLEQLSMEVEPEFQYPLFKQWRGSGEIVKFTTMTEGTTLWKGGEKDKVGQTATNFIKHTNDYWEDVAYDFERDLWDKQPILCWNENTCQSTIGFYDAKNKSVFSYYGRRNRLTFDNYKAISSDRYDEWIVNAYKALKDK